MSLSVLMSVYFKEKPQYLEACLQSLAVQTLKADEVVLVEDGPISSDLKAIVDRFRDSLNIVSVPLDENVGLACALNEGLKHCKNELVARMDTDDIAVSDRFEKQMAFMQANPDIAASSGFIEEWDTALTQKLDQRTLPTEPAAVARFAKRRSPLSHPASIFRKSAVLDVGGYPLLRKAQDYALWSLLLSKGYKFANLPDVLLKMRTGNEMLNRRGWDYFKHEYQLLKLQKQIGFLSNSEFLTNVFLKAGLRMSPSFVKSLAYKFARR